MSGFLCELFLNSGKYIVIYRNEELNRIYNFSCYGRIICYFVILGMYNI